jgi:thiol:disulfide interchange protein DsbA
MNEWLKKNGVDPTKYDATAKSFGVQSKVRRATQISAAYRIDGTPALAVHGRYTVSAEQGRTQQGMLAIADYLIGVARKAK